MVKKCEICGEEFVANIHNKIYCSKKCRDLAAIKHGGNCKYCGSEFKSSNKKQEFCSIQCFNNHNNEPRYKNCECCGEKFRSSISRNKFCSRECYSKSKKKLGKTKCEYCGKEYLLQSTRDNLRFCSRECYNNWHYKSSIMEYKCEYCGSVFKKEGKKSYDYVNGKKRIPKFCSKECADKDRIGKYGRENHPQWKGGVCTINDLFRAGLKYWKKDVIKHNNYICFISGERGGRLVAHHKKPFHLIRDEILNRYGLNEKSCISDCDEENYNKIIEEFRKIHTIDLGIAIKKNLHKIFHRLYGFNATYNDLIEFKQRYENGEFNQLAS